MNSDHVVDVIFAEHVRLSNWRVELREAVRRAEQELPAVDEKLGALSAVLKLYGRGEEAEANAYLIDQYTLGVPNYVLVDVLRDEFKTDLSEDALEARALTLGTRRPYYWNRQRAEEEFGRDDNFDGPFGIVEPGTAPPLKALPVSAPGLEQPSPQICEVVVSPTISPILLSEAHRWAPAARDGATSADKVVVGGVPLTDYMAQWWTTERISIVRRDWPTYRPTEEILDELDALPGKLISKDQLRQFAPTMLRVHRPPDYVVQNQRAAGNKSAGWCTPDRREILLRDYAAGEHWPVIRERLSAEDGPPLPNNSVLGVYCQGHGLLRPKDFKPIIGRASRANAAAKRDETSAPVHTSPAAVSPAGDLPPELLKELSQGLREQIARDQAISSVPVSRPLAPRPERQPTQAATPISALPRAAQEPAQRQQAPQPGKPKTAEDEMIERFIAERGVTKCPAAIVADGVTAVLSPEDRRAISAHMERQEEVLKEKNARRYAGAPSGSARSKWLSAGIDMMKRYGGGEKPTTRLPHGTSEDSGSENENAG